MELETVLKIRPLKNMSALFYATLQTIHNNSVQTHWSYLSFRIHSAFAQNFTTIGDCLNFDCIVATLSKVTGNGTSMRTHLMGQIIGLDASSVQIPKKSKKKILSDSLSPMQRSSFDLKPSLHIFKI